MLRALHWDHVPALNIRIPEGCEDVRKTLVRACSECNGLASDPPHMDYLERHFALKTLLIQRYYRLLLSLDINPKELGLATDASFLNALVHNQLLLRQQVLSAVGYGIHDLSQIESPFLKRKNAEGKTLAALLLAYLTHAPIEPDEPPQMISRQFVSVDDEVHAWSASEFDDFIRLENRSMPKNKRIYSKIDYMNWLQTHPTRAAALELPSDPETIDGFYWRALGS